MTKKTATASTDSRMSASSSILIDNDIDTINMIVTNDIDMVNTGMVDNNQNDGSNVVYDMARSLEITAEQAQDNRPINTKKAYSAKAKEFLTWAEKTFVHEDKLQRGIVSGEKLNYFLQKEVKAKNIANEFSF